ncbi:MAG: hypothetical protein II453_07185 [Alphaproteobacteria bacterium]|nr:hypothetical protein [Alphaproteobacteria bacterium]
MSQNANTLVCETYTSNNMFDEVSCETYTNRGVVGKTGKSAYEQAVEGGYQGTAEEFEQALASDIATVADNISDINTVGQAIAEVKSVADNLTDVSTVADNVSDVNTVAGISSDVTQVAGISSAVQTVSSHDSEVTLVSDNMASVMTTASNISNVNTVAGNATNINTVAGISSDVTTVSTNATAVTTAATNIAAIIAAPTAAQNAANSAAEAQIWAEGTDGQVTPLGGTHSSKGWANRAQELVESIGTVMRYKGSVANYAALQAIQNPTLGDTYNVLDTGSNYTWDGSAWDAIGSAVDLSAYRTAAQQDVIDATKQDTLVSGTNIKTVNGNSLLGSGNVDALPTQTGQSGKFLTTDGTDASWSDKPLANNTTHGLSILGTSSNPYASTSIGKYSNASGMGSIAISDSYGSATASGTYATCVGGDSSATGTAATAFGSHAKATANYATQIGYGTNSETNSVYASTSTSDNWKLLGSDGTIPQARLATGGTNGQVLMTDGTSASWVSPVAGLPLFHHTFQDHILNNSSWLRADTNSWQSGSVYTSAYAHLVDDISGITSETETIAGTTITFKRAADGHKIVDDTQTTNVDAIYTATGIAWYYVLDTTNERFKLPRSKYNFVGLRDSVGNYVAESLPNITGEFGMNSTTGGVSTNAYTDGAFKLGTSVSQNYNTGGNNGNRIAFDASRVSSTYQNSAPVQQRATQAYLYFYVGNTIQNETSVDVAELTEELNGKVDLTSSWGMPLHSFTQLTAGASGTEYTSQGDGEFWIVGQSAGNDCWVSVKEGDWTVNNYNWAMANVVNWGFARRFPVVKGRKYTITFSNFTIHALYFVPAQKTN